MKFLCPIYKQSRDMKSITSTKRLVVMETNIFYKVAIPYFKPFRNMRYNDVMVRGRRLKLRVI